MATMMQRLVGKFGQWTGFGSVWPEVPHRSAFVYDERVPISEVQQKLMDHYFVAPVTPRSISQVIEELQRKISRHERFLSPTWTYRNYAEAKGAMHAVHREFFHREVGIATIGESEHHQIILGGLFSVEFSALLHKGHSHMHPCATYHAKIPTDWM